MSDEREIKATIIEALEALRAWTFQPPVTPLIREQRARVDAALAALRADEDHETRRVRAIEAALDWADFASVTDDVDVRPIVDAALNAYVAPKADEKPEENESERRP